MRTVHFYIDPEDWKEVCRAAVELDASRSQLLRYIIHHWLESKKVRMPYESVPTFQWGELSAVSAEERHAIRQYVKQDRAAVEE